MANITSSARRQIIGGGAPITQNRRRRPQIVGGGAAGAWLYRSLTDYGTKPPTRGADTPLAKPEVLRQTHFWCSQRHLDMQTHLWRSQRHTYKQACINHMHTYRHTYIGHAREKERERYVRILRA